MTPFQPGFEHLSAEEWIKKLREKLGTVKPHLRKDRPMTDEEMMAYAREMSAQWEAERRGDA